jgi:glycosyltransferase involved in cell wall biosynthesis
MKALLISYNMHPPWDNGLKVYGKGLMDSLKTINGLDVEAFGFDDIPRIAHKNYDYIHVVVTGIKPFTNALRTFKQAKVFKHIVTPSMGLRNALSTKVCYGLMNKLENRLVRCFSSNFVANSYFMDGKNVIPPAVNCELFNGLEKTKTTEIISMLETSPIKSGVENLQSTGSPLILYSGPLTEDRFPYRKVLESIKQTTARILIIGRPTNDGSKVQRIQQIIEYCQKLGIQDRIAIAQRLLNEEEKIKLLNFCDVVIQPFARTSQYYVAVDPPFFMLEAMACGKPVITSKAYSFQSFVKNGYNGYTIDWDNKAELKQALADCQSEGMCAHARQTVLQDYSIDSVSKKIQAMYHAYN